MKLLFTTVTALLLISSSCTAQSTWSNKSRILPDELRKVPVSILVTHSPNPNYPELNSESPKNGKYVWKHATSVTSINRSLQVVKAGSYIWYNEEGWKRNVVYNKRQFADRFNCPKGKLEPGVTYTFSKNYRYGDVTYGGDALWYVIAKDEDGNMYKGMGIIETESEIIK